MTSDEWPGLAGQDGVRKAALPSRPYPVQLAELAHDAPEGDQWWHEIKLDGYRMRCVGDGSDIRFVSRNDQDWTDKLSPLVNVMRGLPTSQVILDGEIVVLDAEGRSDFQALQRAFRGRTRSIVYFAFDVTYVGGFDIRRLPLSDRKQVLHEVLSDVEGDLVRISEHLVGNGTVVLQQARQLGVEGIVSKRYDRPYRRGRSSEWLKCKCVTEEDFVVAGFTAPKASRIGFGSLLLGTHDEDGRLIYVGRVGTGFTNEMLEALTDVLDKTRIGRTPFANLTRTEAGRDVTWVKPQIVVRVSYLSWTEEGHLRHPAFVGLRLDSDPSDVFVR